MREVAGRELIKSHPRSLLDYIKRHVYFAKKKSAEAEEAREERFQVQEEES